jgi:hypothetical protein
MDLARDELLRYESEHGSLPKSLAELVPLYLRQDEVETAGKPIYAYDPDKRRFAQTEGSVIQGLWNYSQKPRVDLLPPPVAKPETIATGSVSKTAATPTASPTKLPEAVPKLPEIAQPTKIPNEGEACPPPETGKSKVVVAGAELPVAEPAAPQDLFAAGVLVVPKGPDLPDPPQGAYVFEAELFTDTNYGWEVEPDKDCSGGAYLHCKEGIANGPGQTVHGVFNFYDVHTGTDVTFLRYHINVPKTGDYYVYGRFWTTDTHCSNHTCVAIDKGGPAIGGMDNRTPFRWIWSPVDGSPMRLTAGDHFVHLFIHEDGVRIDQFILSPVPIFGSDPFKANFVPGENTAWQKQKGPPVHLSFDLKSMVVTPRLAPECNLVLRRLRPSDKTARIVVKLLAAAPEGGDLPVADVEVPLKSLPNLCLMPLNFKGLDLENLQRREYLLTADMTVDAEKVFSANVPLMKPWEWEVFGPGRFIGNGQNGPFDGDVEIGKETKGNWAPFKDDAWDHFGVMDYGLQVAENSLHAPTYRTIYVRTIIQVPKSDMYLMKLQSDDQLLIWVDGKPIYRYDGERPVTRAGFKVPLYLEEGVHRLRIRVNQMEGRWQASLRIRTEDDDVSGVVGLPVTGAVVDKKEGK